MNRLEDIIIIGCGGLGRETAFTIERINSVFPKWNILGFLDDSNDLQDKTISGYKVLGKISDLIRYNSSYFIIALGMPEVRKKVYESMMRIDNNLRFATIIDPFATIDFERTVIKEGTIICANCYITVDIEIGKFNYIGANSTIGHDSVISDFVTLYPGVNTAGSTHIGTFCEIGSGSKIIQGLTIGSNTTLGAGSVVIRNIPENCTAVGVPAKPVKYKYSGDDINEK